jgi:hypothetical protein
MMALVGEGVLSPLPGLAVHGGTEPSAHALGYPLAALRAWGHGLGSGLDTGLRTGLVGRFRVVGVLRGETSTFEPSLGAELADASTPPGLFAFLA